MGTRSLIAKQTGPDTYRAIFCQLDGHLESQGAMLLEHFNTPEQVDKLLALGDLYLLHPTLEPDPALPHNFESRQQDVTIAFHRDWGMDGMEAKDYTLEALDSSDELIKFIYIFNQDSEWKYFQGCYLPDNLFLSQCRDIDKQLQALRTEKEILFDTQLESTYAEVKRLSTIVEDYGQEMTSFDEDIFDAIIKSITITPDGIIEFTLMGDLHFSERL